MIKTIAEHDELGQAAFLSRYGFSKAQTYLLVYKGREYDSKAIAGVAHKWEHGAPLSADSFSGGRDHAVGWLKRLGFRVKAIRNPDWVRDEVILACDLVMANGWRGLDAHDERVVELSKLLQLLPIHAAADRNEKFRNPNGVARKTFDLATRHPDYKGQATNGSATDVRVLHEFLARPEVMTKTARLIRLSVTTGELQTLSQHDYDETGDEEGAPEGRLLLRRHRARERSRRLRERKIQSVLRRGGNLACEACGFDFEEVYGDRGAGYVECHHVVPLHEAGEATTRLRDLALICANCHRMIHRHAPWPTPAELRTTIEQHRAQPHGGPAALLPQR
ncbi:HNH endonuclease [Streptomyces sp. SudanB135_2055]|uniref:HNH endonuclease n=1 Tax=Streptomyces sp. SudanB135_2055 TaxID=3035279 RepID=UPI0036DE0DD5